MSYKTNVMNTLVSQTIRIVIGVIINIIAARILGIQKQGQIAYLLVIFGTIGAYGHFGISDSTTYFQKKERYEEQYVFSVNFTYLTINMIVVGIVLWILSALGIILEDYGYGVLIIGVIYIYSQYILTLLGNFCKGNERIKQSNRAMICALLVKCFTIIGMCILGVFNVVSYFIVSTGYILFNLFLLNRVCEYKYTWQIDRTLLTKEFKYGIYVYFAALFIFMTYRADQVMVRHLLDYESLGVYAVGVQIADMVGMLPVSLGIVLEARVYNMNLEDKNSIKFIMKNIKLVFNLCLGIGLIAIPFTPLVKVLYGAPYAEASICIVILLVANAFSSIGKVGHAYFYATGQPKLYLKKTLLAFIINVVLNVQLIPRLGIKGAAIASLIAYIYYGISHLLYFSNIVGIKWYSIICLNRKDLGVIFNKVRELKR